MEDEWIIELFITRWEEAIKALVSPIWCTYEKAAKRILKREQDALEWESYIFQSVRAENFQICLWTGMSSHTTSAWKLW